MYYFNSVDKLAEWRALPDGSWGFERAVPVTIYLPRWYDWLLRSSQLLTKVRLRMVKPEGGELSRGALQQQWVDSFDHRAPEVFRTNLRLIEHAARLLGMRPYVGKQATLFRQSTCHAIASSCRRHRRESWRHRTLSGWVAEPFLMEFISPTRSVIQ